MSAAGIARVRVLLIDDDEIDRRAVRRALGAGYEVHEVTTGPQALKLLDAGPFDCVLLDYNIPGTDTLLLLDELRLRVPVVMLTGQGDVAVAVAAMKRGAQDYLGKNNVSSARLQFAIDRSIEKVHRQRQNATARARLRSDYSAEKQKRRELEESLQLARDIQQNLLPASAPPLDSFEFCGVCLPMEATAGDFFDYFRLADGNLGVVVGDVSGHGIGPALLTAETRAYIRALSQTQTDVGTITSLLNRLLCEDVLPGRFVTLFLASIDPHTRSWSYATAGCPAYWLRRHGEVVELPSLGPPLGMFVDSGFSPERPPPFAPGDILFIATDGLFETHAPDGAMLGKHRCFEVIEAHHDSPVERIVDELLSAKRRFSAESPLTDDTTVLIARAK